MTLEISAVLQARGPAAAVILTDDQVAALGGGKTPAVRITVNGTTVPGRIGRMGGENLLGFNKAIRAQLGVEAGQTITVRIEVDDQPRTVEVPADLAEALTRAGLVKQWDGLAYSHRKEHVRSITEAKKPETRANRIRACLERLQGQ